MIRCPNCGSTAQVRRVNTTFGVNWNSTTQNNFYRCGCGCAFRRSIKFHSDYWTETTTILKQNHKQGEKGNENINNNN